MNKIKKKLIYYFYQKLVKNYKVKNNNFLKMVLAIKNKTKAISFII